MSSVAVDLRNLRGFLVADALGRVIGRVEAPMYGTQPDVPDAIAVRSGLFRGRRLVPAAAIERIDEDKGTLTLTLARDAIQKFL
jgi:hypothetical protein